MKNYSLFILFLFAVSCVKEKEYNTIDSASQVYDLILNLGYDHSDIKSYEDNFIVENDILFPKDISLYNKIDDLNRQAYVDQVLSNKEVVNIKFFLNNVSAWEEGINRAIASWNSIPDVCINFSPAQSISSADVIISYANIDDVAIAHFPVIANQRILLNPNFDYLTNSQKHEVIAHELGHILGLKHTDTPYESPNLGTNIISGTDNHDVRSVMNSGSIPVRSWDGFSNDDTWAAQYLYDFSDSRVSMQALHVNSAGDGTAVISVTAYPADFVAYHFRYKTSNSGSYHHVIQTSNYFSRRNIDCDREEPFTIQCRAYLGCGKYTPWSSGVYQVLGQCDDRDPY